MTEHPAHQLFWRLADRLCTEPDVAVGTMMGFKCLRSAGAFFATLDHRSHALIVKLPRERVQALIAAGAGQAFAPNGRTFREWVSIPEIDEAAWSGLLDEARKFVAEG